VESDPIGLDGGNNSYVFADGSPLQFTDPFGLAPKSTLGGDDPGFENPDEAIKDLEKKLKEPNLPQKEKEKIKRRIKELRRRPSDKQQHHRQICDDGCIKVLEAVRDSVTGALIFITVCIGTLAIP
jgi:hypothetical protein